MSPRGISMMVSSLSNMLQPIADEVATQVGATDEARQTVKTSFAAIQQSADALAKAESTSDQLPLLDRVETDAEAFLQVAGQLPLPPPIAIGVRMASMILSVVSSVVRMVEAEGNTPLAMEQGTISRPARR
jgi:hypothetical protein